ncbi:CBF/Mak21 family-domain-containing protein [Syncephalis fuscata]|nr:CBF/Mak21 family-domain-containing protein [Syncephalis fuscata]
MVSQELKRKRSVAATGNSDYAELIEQARQLAQRVRESKRNLNDILQLIEFCQHKSSEVVHATVQTTGRLFADLLKQGDLPVLKETAPADSAQATVADWLLEQYGLYIDRLIALLNHRQVALQLVSLDTLLLLVRVESAYMTSLEGRYIFAVKLYGRIISTILNTTSLDENLLRTFEDKYHLKYDDLRYQGFLLMTDIFKTASGVLSEHEAATAKKRRVDGSRSNLQVLVDNGFLILERLRAFPSDDSRINTFWTDVSLAEAMHKDDEKRRHQILQLKTHRKAFEGCWLAYLKLPLTLELYRKILLIMHKRLIPFMAQPTLLMDFLTDSYNAGGAISLLALNGLFTLIHKHKLEYPDFYKKLYALFDRNLMHVKYRARFFRLAAIFLASTHLPAYLAAAFIKRMARLTLSAPPSGIAIIIPFIYNLLRQHPSCIVLIHRIPGQDEQEVSTISGLDADPYNYNEEDPAKCQAIHSSLWEIQALDNHYYANVGTLSQIFSQHFNKPSYDLEDFVDHTYSTLFDAETNRRIKKTPAVEYYNEPSLFEDDAALLQDWNMNLFE